MADRKIATNDTLSLFETDSSGHGYVVFGDGRRSKEISVISVLVRGNWVFLNDTSDSPDRQQITRGGDGSGFFAEDGHKGRPGQVGGSMSNSYPTNPDSIKKFEMVKTFAIENGFDGNFLWDEGKEFKVNGITYQSGMTYNESADSLTIHEPALLQTDTRLKGSIIHELEHRNFSRHKAVYMDLENNLRAALKSGWLLQQSSGELTWADGGASIRYTEQPEYDVVKANVLKSIHNHMIYGGKGVSAYGTLYVAAYVNSFNNDKRINTALLKNAVSENFAELGYLKFLNPEMELVNYGFDWSYKQWKSFLKQ